MLNFLVSLTDQFSDFGLAEPFLYKLQEKDRLELCLHKGSFKRKLDIAAGEIKQNLSVRGSTPWNLIFVLKIPKSGNNPIDQSIVANWEKIKALLLDQLKSFAKPKKIVFLMLDDIHFSNAPSINVLPFTNQVLNFDRVGQTGNDDYDIFKSSLFEELDETWISSEIRTSGENLTSFDSLSPKLQTKATNVFRYIKESIQMVIDSEPNDSYQISQTSKLDLADPKRLKKFFRTCSKKLDALLVKPQDWINFRPSSFLKTLIAKEWSAFSKENKGKFQILRFPFTEEGINTQQLNLINLALLLNCIIDKDLWKDMDANVAYEAGIDLERLELSLFSENYHAAMEFVSRRPPGQSKANKRFSLSLFEEPELIDNYPLEKVNIDPAKVPMIKPNTGNDFHKLEDWLSSTNKSLEKISEEVPRILKRCYLENTSKPLIEGESEDYSPLDLEELYLKLDKKHKKDQATLSSLLEADTRFNQYLDFQKEKVPELKLLMQKRPTLKQIMVSLAAAIGATGITFIFKAFFDNNLTANLIGFLICLAFLSVLGFFILRYLLDNIRKTTTDLFVKAQDVKKYMFSNFEAQKEYLFGLMKLNRLEKNKEKVAKTLALVNAKNLRFNYHNSKLKEHYNHAIKLRKLFGQHEKIELTIGELEQLFINYEAPVQQNDIYKPSTYLAVSHQPTELFIDKAIEEYKEAYSLFIRSIRLREDSLLNPKN